jgi:glutamine amidotransferase
MTAGLGIIDSGICNLHSLIKAFHKVAGEQRIEVSADPEVLRHCDRLVLPGVGSAAACMTELRRLELSQFIIEAAREVPLLGICLGMQMLLDHSEENDGVVTLGLIPGRVVRFPAPLPDAPVRLKVPHIGWNQLRWLRSHPIAAGVPDGSWVYFVHSFHAAPKDPQHILAETGYGEDFPSVVARDNVIGMQFHPEKSQQAGLAMLANFTTWDGHVP